jgi:MFS transporter, PAT family, beta-lactamase induction signal transducer AmpG
MPPNAPDSATTTTPLPGRAARQSWRESLAALWQRRVLIMLLLGFAAGLPILLIFSSLSLWLVEAGVERRAVTFFSWAALGYSFKFVWAPLIDRMALPPLTSIFGQRRGWLLLAQAGIISALVGMASVNPADPNGSLTAMAMFAVLLGFSSASQDVVIDAYRIELAPAELQALLSSAYIAGYRIGMIVAGAGALYLASYWGSTKEAYVYAAWQKTYWAMAGAMGVGVLTTLWMPETKRLGAAVQQAHGGNLRLFGVFLGAVSAFVGVFFYVGPLVGVLAGALGGGPLVTLLVEALHLGVALLGAGAAGWVLVHLGLADMAVARETWVVPVRDFFERYGASTAWLVLALIGLYRISDIVLGVISNVFYADMGYSKIEIANAVKTFGVVVSIAGGFLGGILATRYGVMRCLMWGAVMAALTNLVFVVLAKVGYNVPMLYLVVSADNLAAGFASAAFVAFLSSLVNVSFTATQYALFSSLMTLLPKSLGGYSGGMVDALGYTGFFIATTLMGLPVIVLVWLAARRLELRVPSPPR